MRLTEYEKSTIVAKVKEVLGSVDITLFGSRVDDNAKGGDIDLYLKTPNPVARPAKVIASIEAKIILALGDQKVDILLDAPNLERMSIFNVAQNTGVQLWE